MKTLKWGLLVTSALCFLPIQLIGIAADNRALDVRDFWEHSVVAAPFLKNGFKLSRIAQGEIGEPAIYFLKLAVIGPEGEVEKIIHSPEDVTPFVRRIRSPEEALQFVRLRTNYPDFLLFRDKIVEIGDKDNSGLSLSVRAQARAIKASAKAQEEGGYVITRSLLAIGTDPNASRLINATEFVGEDGVYVFEIVNVYDDVEDGFSILLPE